MRPRARSSPAWQRLPPPLAPGADVSSLEKAFAGAAARIKPTVVSITSVRKVKGPHIGQLPFNDPFFERFFRPPRPRGDQEQRGLGSGVVVDDEGHILTNNHVVENADELEIQLADDREFKATVVGTDPKTDLAVIKIDADGLSPATLGDSKQLRVGQWVLAVGSPFGLSQTVSAGIVSALGRGNVGITDYEDFIQTDAAISPGNSGGPLIDLAGNVIGINTAIATRSGGSVGIGFAVPAHMARDVMDQLIDGGKVVRAWIGVLIAELTPQLAESFGYAGKGGILVQDVVADGPAATAGLREGDIIITHDGNKVDDSTDFRNTVAQLKPGTKAKLEIWREGKKKLFELELGELSDDESGGDEPDKPTAPVGLTLQDLTDQLRQRLGVESEAGAVVVRVKPGSLAARGGIRPGDVIEQIGTKRVRSAAQARKLLSAADLDRGVRIRVRRGKYGQFVILKNAK